MGQIISMTMPDGGKSAITCETLADGCIGLGFIRPGQPAQAVKLPMAIARDLAQVIYHELKEDARYPDKAVSYTRADEITLQKAAQALRVAILKALEEADRQEMCLNLFGLQTRTGLPRETLRGIAADLRAEGLAAHKKGLWSDDGTPAGAGYCITKAGKEALRAIEGSP